MQSLGENILQLIYQLMRNEIILVKCNDGEKYFCGRCEELFNIYKSN